MLLVTIIGGKIGKYGIQNDLYTESNEKIELQSKVIPVTKVMAKKSIKIKPNFVVSFSKCLENLLGI